MNQDDNDNRRARDANREKAHDPSYLADRILACAARGLPTGEFLGEVSRMLLSFTACDAVEARVLRRDKLLCCEIELGSGPVAFTEVMPATCLDTDVLIPCRDTDSDLEKICAEITRRRFDPSLPFFTERGSFFIGDTDTPLELSSEACRWAGGRTLHISREFRSLAIIPFRVEDQDRGLLLLKSRQRDFFTRQQMTRDEELARILGIGLVQLRAQVALRERVKELTCLYGIAQVAAKPEISLGNILRETVQILPSGWLYPELAAANIEFNGYSFSTPGFECGIQEQKAEIIVNGERRGSVTVAYSQTMPELDEGPFLKEERNLIDAIVRELALIIERKQAEEEKVKLQEQLLHADRLATIGQLAAGVAHELNEPLGSILGFAQLIEKDDTIPEQVEQDVDKIIRASLHAREVVNKLMLFARQAPAHKDHVNINKMVEEGLYFLESRCAKAGVELVRTLTPDLPTITADSGQILQVVINLVVNAIQAMPDGGRLTIRTDIRDRFVSLAVEDTGVGMSDEVMGQVWLPFFTTKDVNEGTGLGLSVVQGIVTAHGGSVSVTSKVGEGTRFEIQLPVEGPGKKNKQEKTGHAET